MPLANKANINCRFCFRFIGRDEEEINLNGDGIEKPEFGEWSWMTPQQVIQLVSDLNPYSIYDKKIRSAALIAYLLSTGSWLQESCV